MSIIGILLSVLCLFAFIDFKEPLSQQKTIKVLSYNIHYGLGMDKKYDLERIAKVISDQNPDIVGLQEIGDSIMAAKLGELTGMKAVFGPSKENMTGYGDAVLSKLPFQWVGNYSIPSASSSRYQAMAVDVDLSTIYGANKKVRFINTHFDWLRSIGSQEARLATLDVIERGFFKENSDIPAILTGDLNATPESDPLMKARNMSWWNESLGKTLYTIPSRNPNRQIDYVLIRPKTNWNVVDVEVLDEPIASDHLPVLMTLELLN